MDSFSCYSLVLASMVCSKFTVLMNSSNSFFVCLFAGSPMHDDERMGESWGIGVLPLNLTFSPKVGSDYYSTSLWRFSDSVFILGFLLWRGIRGRLLKSLHCTSYSCSQKYESIATGLFLKLCCAWVVKFCIFISKVSVLLSDTKCDRIWQNQSSTHIQSFIFGRLLLNPTATT